MDYSNNLQLRIENLEREVLGLRRIVSQIPTQEAAQRLGMFMGLYVIQATMNFSGELVSEEGVSPEQGDATAYTVNGAEVADRNGRQELIIETSSPHGLHSQDRVVVANVAVGVDGDYKTRIIDTTHFGIGPLPEDFEAPTFGTGEDDPSVTKKVGGPVALQPYVRETAATQLGSVFSDSVMWIAPDTGLGGSFLPAGTLVVLFSDPRSTKPSRSLVCLAAYSCWRIPDPDAAPE